MDIETIKELVNVMKDSGLKTLQVKEDDTEIYLEAHSKHAPAAAETAAAESAPQTADSKEDHGLIELRSKQVGVFYTQPEENSTETFVSEGGKVEKGDQVGLIEAMKLFNKVTAEESGIIEKILVTNGETVEYDQVLMLLRPEGD